MSSRRIARYSTSLLPLSGAAGGGAWYAKLANSMQDPKDRHWRIKTFAPKSLQIKDGLAYFVVPAELNYKKDGKVHVQFDKLSSHQRVTL